MHRLGEALEVASQTKPASLCTVTRPQGTSPSGITATAVAGPLELTVAVPIVLLREQHTHPTVLSSMATCGKNGIPKFY